MALIDRAASQGAGYDWDERPFTSEILDRSHREQIEAAKFFEVDLQAVPKEDLAPAAAGRAILSAIGCVAATAMQRALGDLGDGLIDESESGFKRRSAAIATSMIAATTMASAVKGEGFELETRDCLASVLSHWRMPTYESEHARLVEHAFEMFRELGASDHPKLREWREVLSKLVITDLAPKVGGAAEDVGAVIRNAYASHLKIVISNIR